MISPYLSEEEFSIAVFVSSIIETIFFSSFFLVNGKDIVSILSLINKYRLCPLSLACLSINSTEIGPIFLFGTLIILFKD